MLYLEHDKRGQHYIADLFCVSVTAVTLVIVLIIEGRFAFAI